MTFKRNVALAATMLMVGAAQAATIIDFDDIPFPGGNPLAGAAPPAGYQGLAWGAAWTVSPNDATGWYGGTREPYARSASNFAWNSNGDAYELAVAGGGTFDLTSLWARTWPPISANATAHGFLNGVEVFTQSFALTDTYSLVPLNFTHIDRFTTTAGQQFLIDDITVDNIAAIPEPASTALLLAGLAAIGAALRRRA